MKKSMKLILLSLVLAMTALVFSGCNKTKQVEKEPEFLQEVATTEDAKKEDVNEEKEVEEPKEVKTINLYFRSYQSSTPMNKAQVLEMKEELDKRTATELGIIVNFNWIENDKFEEEIKAKIEAGEEIDGVDAGDPFYLIANDLVQDISQDMKKYAPNYYKTLDESMPERLVSATYEDKLSYIPNLGIWSYRYAVLARKDMLDKYNVKNIENLEQYKEFLQLVKEGEEDLLPGYANPYSFLDLFTQSKGYLAVDGIYGEIKDKDLNIYTIDDLDSFDLGYETIKDWSKNELMAVTQEGIMKFVSGECASAVVNMGLFGNLETYLANLPDLEYELIPIYLDQKQLRSNSSPGGIAVTKNSKNAKSVLEFFEWMQGSQENYDLVMHGVEGKHYNLDGDKLKLIGTKYQNTVSGWYGSTAFMNYKLGRSSLLSQDELLLFLEKLNFENTEIFKDLAEEGIAADKLNNGDIDYGKYNEMKEQIKNVAGDYNEGVFGFIGELQKGEFDKPLKEYTDEFDKEKGTEIKELIKKYRLMFYKIL